MGLFTPDVEKLEAKGDLGGLARAARHRDRGVREAAVAALARQGDRAVEPLRGLLLARSADEGVRIQAAEALGGIGSKAAAAALVEALEPLSEEFEFDPASPASSDALSRAVWAFDRLGTPAVELLLAAMPRHRFTAGLVDALGRTRSGAAAAPLTELLRGDAALRRSACIGLWHLGMYARPGDGVAEAMEAAGSQAVLAETQASANAAGDSELALWATRALGEIPGIATAPSHVLAEAEEQIIEIAERIVPPSEEVTHSFVCSANASVIDAFHSLFRVGAPAYGGSAARYHADESALSARREAAKAAGLAFAGTSLMLSTSKEVSAVADVLGSLGAQSGSGGIHVAYVTVGPAGRDWVRQVYDELVRQAVPQGILPFPVYSTEDGSAARFLLASFEPAP